ncbi:hypothetical protein EW146_g3289 [Bondarzewia mesenterica]|uniref:Uncharacterized protein n=1 Tax=Bondarzewia mesenterica TaxID=1095465 RepID=A0A4S4LZV0_9AGAM|nr:hypothetical protein EW146_g3289 [Bondarzewia mesenterica]
MANTPLNFDFLGGLVSMHGGGQPTSPSHMQFNPEQLLKQRLQLNQLQQLQLQNQIMQQQLELLSGQGGGAIMDGSSDRQKSNPQYLGLPTPMPSTELHAQPSPSTDYVSPMTLSYTDASQYRPDGHPHLPLPDMALSTHHIPNAAHGVHSAPANLVFNTNPPMPLPSPGEMDFDLSPLTSPWLEAYKQDPSRMNSNHKRTASPGEEEQAKLARQRQSPAIHAQNSTTAITRIEIS